YSIASRFLDELPAELLQWLSAVRRRSFNFDASPRTTSPGAPRPTLAREGGAGSVQGTGSIWRVGQNVRHGKFGLGVIIDAEGRGSDARVQVNFRDAGVKWLALEYARLHTALFASPGGHTSLETH